MISCLLLHSDGGLKGIPSGASRWALLNQAKTDEQKSIGFRIADDLLGEYWGAAIADIPHYSQWDIPSGSQHDPERDVISVRVPVAGVILAAGGARRMGLPKQILHWRGEPLIVHVARAALSVGLDPVVIVTGANVQEVAAAVADLPVEVVHNASWKVGQSTSIKTGLDSLPIITGAVVFLQADQPLVTPALIDALLEAHAGSLHPIVAPLVDGERSSPVLFDRSTFSDLAHIEGDVGGRELFTLYSPRWIEWYDRSVQFDVDTEADYRRLLEEYP
jgi:molybdenum cofactor cytidylyltransferase